MLSTDCLPEDGEASTPDGTKSAMATNAYWNRRLMMWKFEKMIVGLTYGAFYISGIHSYPTPHGLYAPFRF
jgi:hypothetical protein